MYLLIILGVVFLIIGLWMFNFPPPKINKWSGYRTKASMKSQKAWQVSNSYAGELFIRWGVGSVIVGITSFLLPIGKFEGSIISGLIALYIPYYVVRKTESKLKELENKT